MATLQDRTTREQLSARGARLRAHAPHTPAEAEAAEQMTAAFDQFDGSDAAYVSYLTGVSLEDMRRVGAI